MRKKDLTNELYKENVSKINPDIEVIDDRYINLDTKLRHKCKICDHE